MKALPRGQIACLDEISLVPPREGIIHDTIELLVNVSSFAIRGGRNNSDL